MYPHFDKPFTNSNAVFKKVLMISTAWDNDRKVVMVI